MRDSRVIVFTNPSTISADATLNGPDISLSGDYVGDHLYGTGTYGVGIEVMAYDITTGTGDGFTLVFKWQVAPDSSGVAGTYVDDTTIGTITVNTDGAFVLDDSIVSTLTRCKLKARLRTIHPWARIVCTSAGITGGEIALVKAWIADGTDAFNTGKFS